MGPTRYQAQHTAMGRNIGELGARLKAMQVLIVETLANLDPADATGLAELREHLLTTRCEFETRRREADEARRRMRAYADRKADPPAEDLATDRVDAPVVAARSQDYAQDAILAAVVALEEAELATLEAILDKIEFDQSASSE